MPVVSIQSSHLSSGVADEIFVPPTPERLRHANDNFVTVAGATRISDAPVDRLFNAGKIDKTQHEAGQRYYADWYAAGLAPLGAIDYGKPQVDGSKPTEVSEFRMAAVDRCNRATRSMGRNRRTIDMVVLLEQGVEAAGREVGFRNAPQARAVGLDRLRAGLDDLAKFYKLVRYA